MYLADISPRSFHRYFPSQEDVVFGDHIPSAEEVREELLRHLDDHAPWPRRSPPAWTAATPTRR
ncbi:hypothetical protein [Streptomyces sp. NPDC047061]|uniref:hypothetical protein n=1 Tax=Streptomyces sp. NPDC047061 TaxID=3154605 RepID=UPI0033FEE44E